MSAISRFGTSRVIYLAAAIVAAVTILGLVGLGAVTGVFPDALLSRKPGDVPVISVPVISPGAADDTAQTRRCAICGTVESIRVVELRGDSTGLAPANNGLAGVAAGDRMEKGDGDGNGNTVMTIIGAATGIFLGNDMERNKRSAYRVTVRMDDGSFRAVSLSSPPVFSVGEKVRVVEGKLVRA